MNEKSYMGAVGLDLNERRTYLKRAARLRVLVDETKSEGARVLCLQLAESYEKLAGPSSDDARIDQLLPATAATA
jgi:hypothetical protein